MDALHWLPRDVARPAAARRYLHGALLLAVLLAAATWPPSKVAPASAYLMLANLPGVPLGPLPALLGQPVRRPWVFAGAEGEVAADVYLPSRGGPLPTVIVVNGALPAGRAYPALAHFAATLAQTGYRTVVPDYPDLLREELTPASYQDLRYTLGHVDSLPGGPAGPIELIGFCVGGSLSLLAMESADAPPVAAVVDLAGYFSTLDMLQVITTDTVDTDRGRVAYQADPWVVVAVARSLVNGLTAADQAVLKPFLVDPAPSSGRAPDWSAVPDEQLSGGGRAVVALLRNRDPDRVAALAASLPPYVADQLRALSPDRSIDRLHSPVFLVADRSDPYIPSVESVKLAAARPDLVRLTYVSLLSHTEPEFQARATPWATVVDAGSGIWQFFVAIDRALVALS